MLITQYHKIGEVIRVDQLTKLFKMKSKVFLIISLAVFIFACTSSNRKENIDVDKPAGISEANGNNKFSSADGNIISSNASKSGNDKFISSSAAVEDGKDSTRKFIRTAEMKFRVRNVFDATYTIEGIAKQFDGFVTYTNLVSELNDKTIVRMSEDSSLETLHYTVENSLTLRVPNTRLDTTLKTIASLIDYLDYRIIKADDVALQMLANKMEQERAVKNERRLTDAIDSKGRKLNETTRAEEQIVNRQEQADRAKIANLSLQDQINFSTVKINIYQRPSIKQSLISNENIDSFKPGLGSRMIEGFKAGWRILEDIIVFIAQIWWLLLGGVIAYLGYRFFRK
jgi:hypothetical protein